MAASASKISQSVRDFYDNLNLNNENLVLNKLNYYIHAVFPGVPNPTIFQVAATNANDLEKPKFNFGGVLVIDNKLTVGPDPDSEYVGQYQGVNVYSDFGEAALNMNMNVIFHGREYDGSTISVMGRQPLAEEVRVLSVVAGTGAFLLARGTVLATTISVDPVTKRGVYLYEMFVVTPAVGLPPKAVDESPAVAVDESPVAA